MHNFDDSGIKRSIDRSFLNFTGAAAVATLAGGLPVPAVAEPSTQAHVNGRRKLGSLEVGSAMKTLMLGLFLSTLSLQSSHAQQSPAPPTETIKTAASHTPEQQEVINLSNMKWDWMADKKVDSLETLFDDKAMFTHMGGTWGKTQELATIKNGGIWYKKAFVYAVDVRMFGNTAVVLEDMDLQAVVGAREVTNPFMVTEVYSKENGKWKLAQLTFSHLLRPVKVDSNKN